MPYVLTLRLSAPLQSWGVRSRFSRRLTESLPTKSGVIGILAAATGVRRTATLEQFADLRFGVRGDQPGSLLRDFHTTHDETGRAMPLSERYYLQDAVFLAAFETDQESRLSEFAGALEHPYFPVFLGRRSCPPDGPIHTEIVSGTLEEVLTTHPWIATERYQSAYLAESSDKRFGQKRLSVQIEPTVGSQDVTVEVIDDEPTSFDPRRRLWRGRRVSSLPGVDPLTLIGKNPTAEDEDPVTRVEQTDHDPMPAVMDAATSDEYSDHEEKR